MGHSNCSSIFQEKMNKLSNGLDYIITYISALIIINIEYFVDNINKLDKALNKLK